MLRRYKAFRSTRGVWTEPTGSPAIQVFALGR
jgi:hypothetical protein